MYWCLEAYFHHRNLVFDWHKIRFKNLYQPYTRQKTKNDSSKQRVSMKIKTFSLENFLATIYTSKKKVFTQFSIYICDVN